ncbi:hypothetical protein BH739_16395 [Enterococcus casseliflavus]|nr:hypothetical protein BH739_16395 [Enterococcus casseliflavus]
METQEKTLLERQMEQATQRMKNLMIHPETIRQFVEDGKVSYSLYGANYWIDKEETPAIYDAVKKLKEQEMLPYFIVHTVMNLGGEDMVMWTILYVSQYEDEWVLDIQDTEVEGADKNLFAYVFNETEPFFSDFKQEILLNLLLFLFTYCEFESILPTTKEEPS